MSFCKIMKKSPKFQQTLFMHFRQKMVNVAGYFFNINFPMCDLVYDKLQTISYRMSYNTSKWVPGSILKSLKAKSVKTFFPT
jgi:hypothetical protein